MAFLNPDYVYVANGVPVRQYFITTHNPNKIDMPGKRTRPLMGVTIHNTEQIRVSGTTMAEQYTRATVNGNMNTVRVHFYVDDTEAWQNLPLDWQGWHAADGSGMGNTATIAIECIGNSFKAEDNAARLAAYLLDLYHLTTANLYTHTYWLNVRDGKGLNLNKDDRCVLRHPYKVCPIYIIPHWADFVKQVGAYQKTEHATEEKPAAAAENTAANEDKTYLYNIVVGVYGKMDNAKNALKEVQKVYPGAFIKRTVKSK